VDGTGEPLDRARGVGRLSGAGVTTGAVLAVVALVLIIAGIVSAVRGYRADQRKIDAIVERVRRRASR